MKNRIINKVACILFCGTTYYNALSATSHNQDWLGEKPALHQSLSSLSIDGSQFTDSDAALNKILFDIKNAENQVQKQLKVEKSSTTRVVIVGTTGSGKSTLVHGLSHKKLRVKASTGRLNIIVDGGELPGFQIGHVLDSATAIPVSWYDQASDIVYWDCPGFMDSRGGGQEIVNAFAIDTLFAPPSRIKLLLTMQESDFEGARGMEAVKRMNKIISLLPDQNQLKQALSLVITKKVDSRFTSLEKLGGLLEDVQKSGNNSNLAEAIDLLSFLTANPGCVFTFPAPMSEGPYNSFTDKARLISSLRASPVLNPNHAFSFEPGVEMLVTEIIHAFANVPKLIYAIEDVIHFDYRGKDLDMLKTWKIFSTSLLAKLSAIDHPSFLAGELKTLLPRHTVSNPIFIGFLDKLTTGGRFIDFAKRVSPGCNVDFEFPIVSEILTPILRNMQSELSVLIESKEFLQKQEKETKAIKDRLEREVQARKQTSEDAQRQLELYERNAREERNRNEARISTLQTEIRNVSTEAQRQREQQLREQERKYDAQISSLQTRLSNADQSSLIYRLNSRIEELESQIQRSRSQRSSGQLVFIQGLGWIQL